MKLLSFQTPEPLFSSRITDYVIELDFLRRKQQESTIEPDLLNQIRAIFRDIDAMASARIDGNKTGINKYLESKEDDDETKGRKVQEVEKVADTLKLLDEGMEEAVIFKGFFAWIHQQIRDGITLESTRNAGKYRHGPARPDSAGNNSPKYHLVEPMLEKLVTFVNKPDAPKYDAIKSAFAHHKFLWIHPFRDANGLVSRLFSYVMLRKQGFAGPTNRILNPTFCMAPDPEKYVHLLQKADSEKEKDLFDYIEFALQGLRNDMVRMDKVMNYNVFKEDILIPAFKHPLFDRVFSEHDRLIIDVAIEKQTFQAADIRFLFPQKQPADISKMIKWLREKDLIINCEDNSRKYVINLQNKYLVKFIVAKLDRAGFIPYN